MNPEQILSDPCASKWLKNALREALGRDPVDAANDAEILAGILADRTRSAAAELNSAERP